MINHERRSWVPEIMYEEYENQELTNGLPFISVPVDKEMPYVLFFFSTKETGEFEPDEEGNEQPIVDMELYQYACMKYLQDSLDPETYDQVRKAVNLLPLAEARKKGAHKTGEFVQDIANKKQEEILISNV